MAYVLIEGTCRLALQATDLADATCGTIRRKLFKIGALVTISVRRIKFAMASGCPYKAVFATAHRALDTSGAETASPTAPMGPQTDPARPSPPASRATFDAETRPARVRRSERTGNTKAP